MSGELILRIGFILSVLPLSGCRDDAAEWTAFKANHHCIIVGKMDESTSITSRGDLAFNDAKDGWLCDDGITYWKNRE